MKTSKFELYVAQLLREEGGRAPENLNYSTLRHVFDSCKDRGFRPEGRVAMGFAKAEDGTIAKPESSTLVQAESSTLAKAEDGTIAKAESSTLARPSTGIEHQPATDTLLQPAVVTEPTLYGLSLTQARRLWRDYYGICGVEKMGAEWLRRMTYDDWLIGLQRACWLPLCCEKMPFQRLSNAVADAVRFYDDAPTVLHQLLDILEQQRQLFCRPFAPLPPSDVINNNITRRLYCQIRSTEVCAEVVRVLTDKRLAFAAEQENIAEMGVKKGVL